MNLYSDSGAPVPEFIAAFHATELSSFGEPGGWMTAEERLAVVARARALRAGAGLQAAGDADGPDPASVLPRSLLELIEKLALSPQTFARADLDRARAAGVGDCEYVEVVALVSRVVNLDVFARGIGLAPRKLPTAADGEPDCERPQTAVAEGAWLATVPAGPDGGDVGRAIYGENLMPFIYRALSLVPSEARRIIAGGNAQYLTLEHFFDFNYSLYPALTRPQLELVAGRVSAFNECFY